MPARPGQRLWTRDEVRLAMHLYCRLPFGRLDQRNPEVRELAQSLGRTPSAVALRLVNLASLDPAIRESGRTGMQNASALDREVWNEFHDDWDTLVLECERSRERRGAGTAPAAPAERSDAADDGLSLDDFTGETRRRVVETRLGQDFFRRAVLSSYGERCCMSGTDDPRLLVASHIRPWRDDRANRLNPRNGLCLSALHDRAFDRWLVAIAADFTVLVSSSLKQADAFTRSVFVPLEGRRIQLPERFHPNPAFLAWHRERFVA